MLDAVDAASRHDLDVHPPQVHRPRRPGLHEYTRSEPCTLNPEPSILNPEPLTLNPKPLTLNP